MTTPTGDITLGDVAAELGVALPLTLGDARVLALRGGGGLPVTLGELRGKSRFTVDFTIGGQGNLTLGSPSAGNRRTYRDLTAAIVGGGSYTCAWSVVSGASYSQFVGATNANTARWAQDYNINDSGLIEETVTIRLTVTDPATGETKFADHPVTLG